MKHKQLKEGDVVRINDDSTDWIGDSHLGKRTRRNLAKIIKPGPICILEIHNGEIRGCVDEFLTVVS